MLVLSRKKSEEIVIDLSSVDLSQLANKKVTLSIVDILNGKVRVGIVADRAIPIHRREVYERITANGTSEPDGSSAGDQPRDRSGAGAVEPARGG